MKRVGKQVLTVRAINADEREYNAKTEDNSARIVALLQPIYKVGIDKPTQEDFWAAVIDAAGKVTITDFFIIKRYF